MKFEYGGYLHENGAPAWFEKGDEERQKFLHEHAMADAERALPSIRERHPNATVHAVQIKEGKDIMHPQRVPVGWSVTVTT